MISRIRSFNEAGPAYRLGANDKGGDPVRVAAMQGLAGFGPEASAAVPELTLALGDQDLRVRWFAAEALGLDRSGRQGLGPRPGRDAAIPGRGDRRAGETAMGR